MQSRTTLDFSLPWAIHCIPPFQLIVSQTVVPNCYFHRFATIKCNQVPLLIFYSKGKLHYKLLYSISNNLSSCHGYMYSAKVIRIV